MDCERVLKRLFTYLTYPPASNVSPSHLASSGFSYCGIGDMVECDLCGAVVKQLQSFSDLRAKHQSASPGCNVFDKLRAVVGGDCSDQFQAEFASQQLMSRLSQIERRVFHKESGDNRLERTLKWLSRQHVHKKVLSVIACRVPAPDSSVRITSAAPSVLISAAPNLSVCSAEYSHPTLTTESQFLHEYEVNARMDLPIVRIVMNMGYSQDLIREVIVQHLAVGKEITSAQRIVEAIAILQQLNDDASDKAPKSAPEIALKSALKLAHTPTHKNGSGNDEDAGNFRLSDVPD